MTYSGEPMESAKHIARETFWNFFTSEKSKKCLAKFSIHYMKNGVVISKYLPENWIASGVFIHEEHILNPSDLHFARYTNKTPNNLLYFLSIVKPIFSCKNMPNFEILDICQTVS